MEESLMDKISNNLILVMIVSSVVSAVTAIYLETYFDFKTVFTELLVSNNYIPLLYAIFGSVAISLLVLYPMLIFVLGADVVSQYGGPILYPLILVRDLLLRLYNYTYNRFLKEKLEDVPKYFNITLDLSDHRKKSIKSLIVFIVLQYLITFRFNVPRWIILYVTSIVINCYRDHY